MHAKVDEAMKFLAEAYAAKEGAKRHKEVMVEIATPKKMPGRRQKKLRKAANQRISEAKSDGDDVISKMQENVSTTPVVATLTCLSPRRLCVTCRMPCPRWLRTGAELERHR
jgi:hypothetical protein